MSIKTPALCGIIVKKFANLLERSEKFFYFIWYFKLKIANITLSANTSTSKLNLLIGDAIANLCLDERIFILKSTSYQNVFFFV